MGNIWDVAKLAGVSPATVSRVLNGSMPVREETKQRVLQAVESLGYEPNAAARSLIFRQTSAVGIIIRDICDPFFPPVVRGMTSVANREGYSAFLCELSQDPNSTLYMRLIREKRVDGVIIASSRIPTEGVQRIAALGIPVVLIGRRMAGIPSICFDNTQGSYEMTAHLIALGHTRIIHITEPTDVGTAAERFQGYKNAMRDHGIWDERFVLIEEHSPAGGYRAAHQMLKCFPEATAVFALDDGMAIGVMQALQEAGRRIPEEIAVAGADDIDLAAHLTPPLTTLHVEKEAMGICAMELLLAVIEGHPLAEKEVTLQPTLAIRQSTREK